MAGYGNFCFDANQTTGAVYNNAVFFAFHIFLLLQGQDEWMGDGFHSSVHSVTCGQGGDWTAVMIYVMKLIFDGRTCYDSCRS